jgi:hypothetical protein
MDNWADPWSDNADTTPAPTNAVTLPPTTTFAPAPVLLNGFLDDAGWGNDEGSFGDWATSTRKEDEDATPVETRVIEAITPTDHEEPSRNTLWGAEEKADGYIGQQEGDWTESNSKTPNDNDQVHLETSDSSTTVSAVDATEDIVSHNPVHPRLDDDSSARPSTSPSEGSHNEIPIESPRTSYEEDRGAEEDATNEKGQDKLRDVHVRSSPRITTRVPERGSSKDADVGRYLDDITELHEVEGEAQVARYSIDTPHAGLGLADVATKEHPERQTVDATTVPGHSRTYNIDQDLLDSLFPSPKQVKKVGEAADDPIYTTSSRKAWYRLTRKQTLREFNNGNADDNYIRVTWANSNVRSEVNKIVARWAREDRISGTGPGARASFYWDSPAPLATNTSSMHIQDKSSVVTPDEPAPTRQSLPPLSTNIPPAFNWSTPLASDDSGQQSNSRARSTSSPMVSSHPAIRRVLAQEGGGVPLKSSPPKPQPSIPESLATVAESPSAAVSSSTPPVTSISTHSADPWADLTSLDTITAPTKELINMPIDNEGDDEWGDMISSPTMSIPSANKSTSQATTWSNTFSAPSSTPLSGNPLSIQDPSSDPMSASVIVRLKSTISPTSALFKANAFVPLGPEVGPIGPGILKPTNRSASSVSKTTIKAPVSKVSKEVMQTGARDEYVPSAAADLFTSWESAAPEALSNEHRPYHVSISPSSLPPLKTSQLAPRPTPADNGNNAWADVDFSMFETARPATPPPPPPAEARYDQSDSYSPLNYSPRSVRGDSPARSVTRSRGNTLLPALQMLTGATNSSQRQKVDEDQIVADILSGLPDLSYMLA